MVPSCSPNFLLQRALTLFPNAPALRDDAQEIRFGELGEHIFRAANALAAAGVTEGARVAVISQDNQQAVELFLATLWRSAVFVPLHTALHPRQLAAMLTDAQPTLVAADPQHLSLAETAIGLANLHPHIWVLGEASERSSAPAYASLLAATSSEPNESRITSQTPAAMCYTPGTADRRKGVVLTHANLWSAALQLATAVPVAPGQTGVVGALPLYRALGWNQIIYLLAQGAEMLLLSNTTPTAWQTALSHADVVAMTPLQLRRWLAHADQWSARPKAGCRVLLCGGPVPEALLSQAENALGIQTYVSYGLTEAAGPVTCTPAPSGQWQADRQEPATVGRPLPGIAVELVDDNYQPLPHDGVQEGEVMVRAPGIMAGFWQAPEVTEARLKDGWLLTGDLGTLNADGILHLTGRRLRQIVSGGETIGITEVQDVLYRHPAVREAVVYAVPDEELGERVEALITLKAGASLSEVELKAFCAEHLAPFEVPAQIQFVSESPRTASGKVIRHTVREKYIERGGKKGETG